MANLDLTTLQTQIQSKIDVVSNTTPAQTIHQLASTVVANTGVSVSVDTVANLPNIYLDDVPIGTMVFVDETKDFYIAGVNQWLNLEGKIAKAGYNVLWSWGINDLGQLGNNNTTTNSSPVSVVGGFTDWCQVSAGETQSIGIRTNGTIWAWGSNTCGRLGDGTTVNKSSPVSVIGGFTDWCQVSSRGVHTAAVRKNGTLWTWGCGQYGRLGDNTTVDKSSPISVVGGFTDWCQVSTGRYISTAIRTNGTLWTWGLGNCGMLGNNSVLSTLSPVSVVGGFTDWCQVSAGADHIASVRRNGTLWTWGVNLNGKLGDGTTVDKSSPISVIGGFTDWCQVAAGANHTAAVRQNGTLWTWGRNQLGQLGSGTTIDRSSPLSVVGGFTNWCQVSAGSAFSAAVRTDGTLWTWGRNTCGLLANGDTSDRCSPVSVIGGICVWNQVSASLRMGSTCQHTIAF